MLGKAAEIGLEPAKKAAVVLAELVAVEGMMMEAAADPAGAD